MVKENNCKATPKEELIKKKSKTSFKFQTEFTERETEEPKKWLSFYAKKSYFSFRLDSWGYFDPRPVIISNVTSILVILTLAVSLITLSLTWFHITLIPFLFFGWGEFFLKLPFNTNKTDECENPSYGFYMYHIDPAPGKINFPTCFIWQWNNYKSWDMPWARTFIRHSILLKNNCWEHGGPKNRKQFYNDEWKDRQYVIEYDFTDKFDGTIIPTKIYVEEREWRQHWLKWTKFNSHVRRVIDVHFSKEVGSRKVSWKGGTLGCSWLMKKGETALECIKRMETERTFR